MKCFQKSVSKDVRYLLRSFQYKWMIQKIILMMVCVFSANGVIYAEIPREPVTISVVVVNPSEDKVQKFPVKIDLPQEVEPDTVIEHGSLKLEYDDQRSIYFLYNQQVELQPKETRVFKVIVQDVWFVPDAQLKRLKNHTEILVGRLKGSEYYESAQKLATTIYERLDQIMVAQADETISQKRRIGSYRHHLVEIEKIEKDLAEIEKLLTFKGGVPVPEMLEESPLKSDAPSTKTTWLIILIILVFIGLIAGQFYFTWSRRAQAEREFEDRQINDLPGAVQKDRKDSEGPSQVA